MPDKPKSDLHGLPYNPPMEAPDFALTDQSGSTFKLSEQRGKAVLLFFGYTTCPDVCPTTLVNLKKVHGMLGDQAGKVRFVLVTVDPERDTPEKLTEFINTTGHESFIGLTSTREKLETVWKSYSVYVEREDAPGSPAGYFVNHTASTFLITPDGLLTVVYQFGADPKDIAADLKKILSKGV